MRVYIYKEHPTVVVAPNRVAAMKLLLAALRARGKRYDISDANPSLVPLDPKFEGAYVLEVE